MDTRQPGAPPAISSTARRRRRNGGHVEGVRYFLAKAGSSNDAPQLGQEVASEGEALIQAFRSGQTFYTLSMWRAVPEVNGGGSPVIVKQALEPKPVQS
jgi:hypothetical protein